jgi:hypothetical protein
LTFFLKLAVNLAIFFTGLISGLSIDSDNNSGFNHKKEQEQKWWRGTVLT